MTKQHRTGPVQALRELWATRLRLLTALALIAVVAFALQPHRKTRAPEADERPSTESMIEGSRFRAQVEPPLPHTFPVTTRYGDWTNLGPDNYGGKVWDIAVSPVNSDVVFAAYGDGGGLWKTTDGGATWQIVNDRARNNTITSVSICNANPSVVIAGLGSPSTAYTNVDIGVLKSTDGGVTWQAIGPVAGAQYSFVDVKCSINDANTYYAADEQAIYKTTNGGASWKMLLEYDGPTWYTGFPSITLHPTDPNTLILWGKSVDVQRSSDGGNTWARVGQNMDQSHPAIFAWSPSNPSIVYCEREGPNFPSMLTYNSADSGQTWTPGVVLPEFEQGRYDQSIAVDPTNASRVLVANSSMSESLDGLQSHRVISAGHGDFLKIAFAPSNPQVVYHGNDGGVWKSTQGGHDGTWSRADIGVRTNKTFGFAVDGVTGKIYVSAGDYAGILYQPGQGWGNMGGGSEWSYFYVNPHDPTDVYEPGAYGIFRVGAPNTQWPNIGPDLTAGKRWYNNRMVFHPTDPNTIYSATTNGLWQSPDRGKTWMHLGPDSAAQAFVTGGIPQYFDVAPSDPNTIYAAFLGNGGTLWRTTDGGKTWTPLHNPAYADYTLDSFAIDPTNPQKLYFSTSPGVYVSTDGGATLTPTANNLPWISSPQVMIDPSDPSRLFLATIPGIMLSEDGGASWSQLGQSMPRGIQWFMQMVNHKLYVSNAQSIWMMDFSKAATLPSIASQNGVVDAASYVPRLAKGAWATIFGTTLSQSTRSWGAPDFSGNVMPTSLDGVRVLVNGVQAPLSYISPTQVNFQVPTNLAGASASIVISNSIGQSNSVTFGYQDVQPYFFLVGNDRKYAAVTHSDGTLVAPVGYFGASVNCSPAHPGETVVLYGSGFGATNPSIPSGQLVSAPAPLANVAALSITVGSQSARIAFAGLTIAGVYQTNFVVPNVPDGDLLLLGVIAGLQTQAGVSLTVAK
jgi:uncharacterized protein (TIGR03437 family)